MTKMYGDIPPMKIKLVCTILSCVIVITLTCITIYKQSPKPVANITIAKPHKTSFHLVTDKKRAPNVFVSDYETFQGLERSKYRLSFIARGNVKDFTCNCTVTRDWTSLIAINVPAMDKNDTASVWKEFEATFEPEGDMISVTFILEEKGEIWIEDLKLKKVE